MGKLFNATATATKKKRKKERMPSSHALSKFYMY